MELPSFSFHHGAISVPDLEAAISWYGEVLGFQLERRFSVDKAGARAAFVKRDKLRFEIFEVAGASSLPEERRSPQGDLRTHGNKHVAFRVSDFEAFLAEMTAHGTQIVMIIREEFGKGFFIRDCAGNLIEFVEEQGD